MALIPPNDNKGDFNTSAFAPDVWTDVQRTNNEIIDRNDMPFASTVEYKGYYKAEATGDHTFNLTGSTNVTGYSWVSSAPRGSDHIRQGGTAPVTLSSQKSYGIIIPYRNVQSWPFSDPNVLGTSFLGFGYWPRQGYGTKGNGNTSGWKKYYSGTDAPNTRCGYTGNQAPDHETFIPGDIRTYGTNYPRFVGEKAGPGWQGPEDPNFADPCWSGSASAGTPRPLFRLENTFTDKFDSTKVPTDMGKTSQVFLDTSFKAEGTGNNEDYARFQSVATDGDNVFVWPSRVSTIRVTNRGKRFPERVQIRFSLRINVADTYTFEWRSRDGLKIWYVNGANDAREFIKFPDDSGSNPCNLDSTNTSNLGWRPGGGTIDGKYAGFDGTLSLPANKIIQFHGYAVGREFSDTNQTINEHGFSLVVRDSSGNKVWTTESLLEGSAGSGIIGIDECGYHALLDDAQRVDANRVSEFYKLDGFKGYASGEIFRADSQEGDNTARDPSTTRQYLWSNCTSKLREGTSVPGTVYLRQGDFYFIRTILSNDENRSANYRFTVTPPTGGIAQSVKFTGNGDPGSDTSVGGNTGGNGIPISVDVLCNSVLAPNGQAVGNDVNFALIESLGVVLNLNVLNVSDDEIGREGQAEQLPDGQTEDPGSKVIQFTDNNSNNINITLSRLVRGGKDGLAPLTETERTAIFDTFDRQITNDQVLEYETFKSAITSQAVIPWGLVIGNQDPGGNYPYIYHSVGEVIESICTGVPIEVPTINNTINTNNNSSNNNFSSGGTGDCLDINIDSALVGSGASQITSACRDTCKTPDKFTRPESQYKKTSSDFTGMDSRYFNKVKLQNSYGVVAPSTWSAPAKSPYGDYDRSRLSANNSDSVKFNPGEVTAVPLFVPDVFVPDEFDINANDQGAFDCSYKFELSSNTFFYNPDNSSGEIGVQRPYLVWWVSATPGGPKIGDYKITRPSYSTTPRMYATMSYEQYVADLAKDPSMRVFDGYLGNTYGARWWNLAPLKYQDVQNLDFDIPDVGTTAFVDLLSTKGYTTNEIRIRGTVTSPDCSTQNRIQNRSGVDSSFRSAPDMIPFI